MLVGPLFYVKSNSVGTVVYVDSSPKSTIDEAFLKKVKEWLKAIGV